MIARQLGLDLEPPRVPAALSSFHVRSEMTPAEALAGESRARTQEALILGWFEAEDRRRPGARFTPSDVHAAFDWYELTSIRRALTNMTTAGDLVHWPKDRVPSPRGAMESRWSLAP